MDVDILSWLDAEEPVRSAYSAPANTLTSPDIAELSFEISRDVLLSLLDKAISIVPTRDIIPVLTNFKFELYDNELKVTASSMESSIELKTTQVDIKVEGAGIFPAKQLISVVKEINPGSNIFFEVTSQGLVVVAGTFSIELALHANGKFPDNDDLTNVVWHEVDRKSFVDAISVVKYALPGKEHSGQDSLRMINIKGGKFTACDGNRFQQVRIDSFKLKMQLPAYKIPSLVKILSGSDLENVEISETADMLVFRLSNIVFYINKINDPYPNVEQLWLRPALSNDQELIVNRQELITAIKQVRLGSDNNAIGLVLESDSVKLVAKNDLNKTASTTISAKWSGKPRTVVVNFIHLAEMLKAYTPGECKFLLCADDKNYKSPILLKDDDTMAIATIAQLLTYRAGLS